MATKKTAAKPAVEEIDVEVDEVEEAPKKKAAPKRPEIAFGTKELAEHVNAEAGTSYDAYALRILLRKLTKDGVVTRDDSSGRARYSFSGPKDPQVKAIVKAVKEGAADKAKAERLDELKEKRKATPKKAAKKAKAPKAAEPVEEIEDDLDVEDI